MKASIASWGPAGWTFLHTISFVYPDNPTLEDKRRIINFLYSFKDVIPCQRCRTDFTSMVHQTFGKTKEDAITSRYFDNRDALSRVLVDMHNHVNERLRKKIWAYDDVYNLYLTPTSVSRPNTMLLMLVILLVVIVILVVYYIILTKKYRMK